VTIIKLYQKSSVWCFAALTHIYHWANSQSPGSAGALVTIGGEYGSFPDRSVTVVAGSAQSIGGEYGFPIPRGLYVRLRSASRWSRRHRLTASGRTWHRDELDGRGHQLRRAVGGETALSHAEQLVRTEIRKTVQHREGIKKVSGLTERWRSQTTAIQLPWRCRRRRKAQGTSDKLLKRIRRTDRGRTSGTTTTATACRSCARWYARWSRLANRRRRARRGGTIHTRRRRLWTTTTANCWLSTRHRSTYARPTSTPRRPTLRRWHRRASRGRPVSRRPQLPVVDGRLPLSRQLLPCAFFAAQNHFDDIDQLRTSGLTSVWSPRRKDRRWQFVDSDVLVRCHKHQRQWLVAVHWHLTLDAWRCALNVTSNVRILVFFAFSLFCLYGMCISALFYVS